MLGKSLRDQIVLHDIKELCKEFKSINSMLEKMEEDQIVFHKGLKSLYKVLHKMKEI